jgi:hypothetical protein
MSENMTSASRGKLLILVLSVIAIVSLAIVYVHETNPFNAAIKGKYKPGLDDEIDNAVKKAQDVYKNRKNAGTDFSSGPCLTNDLMPDWVVDIAHNPRQKLDELAENQCPAYIEGRAAHFVELDLEGEVIRIK